MRTAPAFLVCDCRGVLRFAALVVFLSACDDEGVEDPRDASATIEAGHDDVAIAIDAASGSDAALDAPSPDAEIADTRWPAAFEWQGHAPELLSETGLFANIGTKQISPHLRAFAPAFPLWSDDAAKQRWMWLPPGTQIDTSDMDHWRFPVGARFFKEFAAAGKRLETRMIVRTGLGDMDYFMASYVWDEQEQDAMLAMQGATNVRGTDHDVPKAKDCWACHQGEKGRVLGLSALQLADVGKGERLAQLVAENLLTHAPSPSAMAGINGEGVVKQALGYLHGNCGHCHSDIGVARPDTDMVLRMAVGERDLQQSALYTTSVGKALFKYRRPGLTLRVDPGHPETSALLFRMASRERLDMMPPLGTKHADELGVALVSKWIASLRAP